MSHSQPDVIYSIVQSSLDRGTQITQMEAVERGWGCGLRVCVGKCVRLSGFVHFLVVLTVCVHAPIRL